MSYVNNLDGLTRGPGNDKESDVENAISWTLKFNSFGRWEMRFLY